MVHKIKGGLWILNHTIHRKQAQKVTHVQTQINSSKEKMNDSGGETKDQKQQPWLTNNF